MNRKLHGRLAAAFLIALFLGLALTPFLPTPTAGAEPCGSSYEGKFLRVLEICAGTPTDCERITVCPPPY